MATDSPTREELLAEVAALRKSESFYRQVVENLREAVFTTDRQGNFTWICPNAEVIFDMTADEIQERGNIENLLGKDLLLPGELERAGSIINRECRVRDREGIVHWLLVDMKKVLVNGGHNLFSCRDITARKEAEEEIKRLNESLESQVEIRTLQLEGMLDEAKRENQERRRAEEALQASEEKHRSMLETLLYGVCVIQDGRVVFANQALSDLSGITLEEVRRFTIEDIFGIIVEGDRPKVQENFRRRMQGEPVEERYTVRGRHRDGTIRYITIEASRVILAEGHGVQVLVRDVTDQRVAEAALRESEERYRLLVETTNLGIGYYDREHRASFFNHQAASFMGGKPPDFVGKTMVELFGHEEGESYARRLDAAKTAAEPVSFEDLVTLPGGTRWFQSNFFAVRGEEGNVLGIQVISRDISEKKAAEEELRLSVERFRGLFENMSSGVAVYEAVEEGEDFLFSDVNRAAETIDNLSRDDVVGKKLSRTFPAVKEFGLFDVLQRVWRTGNPERFPVKHYKDDGIQGWRDNFVLKLPTGEMVAIYDDVTAQKQAEDDVLQAHQELRNLTAHLERVREEERARIAKTAHDELGQELTALKLDLSWLEKKLSTKDENMKARLQSMKALTDDLVQTVKRIVSDLRPGVLDELGLAAAVEWQVRDFQERTGVRTRLKVEPEEILMEKHRSEALFRILQETLTNVARHANAHEVKVSLSERTGRVSLVVQDDGRGFDAEIVDRAEAFGLAGLRERATYLGGGVVVESEPGRGTRVWVNVPATEEDEE